MLKDLYLKFKVFRVLTMGSTLKPLQLFQKLMVSIIPVLFMVPSISLASRYFLGIPIPEITQPVYIKPSIIGSQLTVLSQPGGSVTETVTLNMEIIGIDVNESTLKTRVQLVIPDALIENLVYGEEFDHVYVKDQHGLLSIKEDYRDVRLGLYFYADQIL